MSRSEAYIYQSLGPRQIRLIKINHAGFGGPKSAPGSYQQAVIELETVSLSANPKYEALSYSWDGQTCDHPIICHGRTLMTTANCIRLLQRLKDRAMKRFWIDALRINQTSNGNQEKSLQIPLMGEIYRKAERALIWLGESSEETLKTFHYLNDIATILANNTLQFSTRCWEQLAGRRRSFEDANIEMFGGCGTTDNNMMTVIFNRPWFQRVWTVQEVALPKYATILCGESEMAWSWFASAIDALAMLEQRLGQEHTNETSLRQKIAIHQGLRTYIQQHMQQARLSELKLAYLLESTIRLRATEPQDKFYGLWGVLEALGITGLPRVDSATTIADVYTRASPMVLERDRSLDLLRLQGGRKPVPETHLAYPSWVLDLAGNPPPFISNKRHMAAGNTHQSYFNFSDANTLRVFGRKIDPIKNRARALMPWEYDLNLRIEAGEPVLVSERLEAMVQRVTAMREWAGLALGGQSRFLGSLGHAMAALRDTITQSGYVNNNLDERLSEATWNSFSDWLKILLSYKAAGTNAEMDEVERKIDAAVTAAIDDSFLKHEWLNGDVSPEDILTNPAWRILMAWIKGHTRVLQIHIYKMTMEHTFFLTEKGHMGIASDNVKDGDDVMLLAGLNLPMILSPTAAGKHLVVGAAYIEGVMQGGLWSEEELQYFELA